MEIDIRSIDSVLMNMDNEKERLINCINLFKRYNLRMFDRFTPIRDKYIWRSLLLTKLVLLYKYKPPFIMYEDDIKLNPNAHSFILDIPNNSDCIYLGISRNGAHCELDTDHGAVYTKYAKNIYKVHECFCAHAILFLNEKSITTHINSLVHALDKGEASDVGQCRFTKHINTYTTNHPIFYQDDRDNDRVYQTLFSVENYLKEQPRICKFCNKDRFEKI